MTIIGGNVLIVDTGQFIVVAILNFIEESGNVFNIEILLGTHGVSHGKQNPNDSTD